MTSLCPRQLPAKYDGAVPNPLKLSKSDARRALVRHHFAPCLRQQDAFERLRSIQFDPIAPVGCNHDLVLQARVKGYKVGDWQKLAYQDRHVYDGWDKQACLIPFDGWAVRRIFWGWSERSKRFLSEHPEATHSILQDIENRGPLQPKDFEFQQRREDLVGTWYGPSVTKNVLRALWNTGQVMTSGRRSGQHLYDLTSRIVPHELLSLPMLPEEDAIREIVLDRHRAMGLLRLSPPPEVWASNIYYAHVRNAAIKALVERSEIVPVEVEGMKGHATPAFIALLDKPSLAPRVVFVAPLDQFLWDRKMTAHVFDFGYVWEIYTPEAKRRWGYYVLPVLYGDALVARVEFFCRKGVLELRRWHFEGTDPGPKFLKELERTLRDFMKYCSATSIQAEADIDPKIRDLALGLSAVT